VRPNPCSRHLYRSIRTSQRAILKRYPPRPKPLGLKRPALNDSARTTNYRITRGEWDHHPRARQKYITLSSASFNFQRRITCIESQQCSQWSLGGIMATFKCDVCQQESRFLSLQNSMRSAGVCRSTIYYWMERRWIHWRELPSGRRMICYNSLSRSARSETRSLPPPFGAGFVKPT